MASRRLRYAAQLAVTALFLYFVVSFADSAELASTLSGARPLPYLGAVASLAGVYGFSTLRWRAAVRGHGYDLGLRESVEVVAIAYGFNKFMPGNMGDLTRSKVTELFKEVEDHGEVIAAVALERFSDLVALLALLAVSLPLAVDTLPSGIPLLLAGVAAVIAGSASAILYAEKYNVLLERFSPFLPDRVEGFASRFLDSLQRASARQVSEMVLFSTMRWLSAVAVFHLSAAAVGVYPGFWLSVAASSSMALVAALPITPGGLGPVEGAGAGVLALNGFAYSAALAAVLVARSVGFLVQGFIGYVVYLHRG